MGLCNKHSLSQGLPIDTLGMILISERLGANKNILIADSHAKTNGFDTRDVDKVAKDYMDTLCRLIDNLSLGDWRVALASEIDKTTDYKGIFDSIKEENEYARRELADIEWFRRHSGIRLKVGWALNGDKNSSETFFDDKYRQLFSEEVAFVYVEAGRTFDSKKPKSVPYFCESAESRILLKREENARRKIDFAKQTFGEQGVATYGNFLKRLVRLYDSVIEPTERGALQYRVQEILERCLK